MSAPRTVAARRVVIFQLVTTALLLLASLAAPRVAQAATSTIGRTWPVLEPDAMAEIEARAASLPPDLSARFGPRARWDALQAATLGSATVDRVRTIVPFHRLETDVILPDGRVLYPAGFTFNPLAFVSLPQRLVIVAPRDLDWALGIARPADFILLAGDAAAPGRRSADVLTLADHVRRPLYILEPRVKARLGLTVAPVIVVQSGQKLVLTEFGPQHLGPVRSERRP